MLAFITFAYWKDMEADFYVVLRFSAQKDNAAKHGVVGLLRGLRHTAPRDKIAISLVAPAITATPILSSATSEFGQVVSQLTSAGVPINTPERIAEVVVWILSQGQKANGMGLMVQGGLVTDLEKGIAKTRRSWMGDVMAKMYSSGTGFNVFEKLGADGGMGSSKL